MPTPQQIQNRKDYLAYLANPSASGYLLIARIRKELEEEFKQKTDAAIKEIMDQAISRSLELVSDQVEKLTKRIAKGDRGEPGGKPVAGADFPIPQDGVSPDIDEVVERVLALIPKPKPNKDGKSLSLASVRKLAEDSIRLWFLEHPQATKDELIKFASENQKDFEPDVWAEKLARAIEAQPYEKKLDYYTGLKNQPRIPKEQAGRITKGGGGHTIQEGGVAQTQRTNLNFDANFTVTDSAGNDRTTIGLLVPATIPGGADTEVQFNDGETAFGGDPGMTYNKTTDKLTLLGDVEADQLVSTIVTGTAPLVVASTTVVTNLNADLFDGLSASAFRKTIAKIRVVDAAGNGDYTTISAAIAAASSGDIIYVTPGTYTNSGVQTLPSGVSLIGADRKRTIWNITSTEDGALYLAGSNVVSDMRITNTLTDSLSSVIANSVSAANVYVTRVDMTGGIDVIALSSTASNWTFDDCLWDDFYWDGGSVGGTNIIFKNNVIIASPTITTSPAAWLYVSTTGTIYLENNEIQITNAANEQDLSFVRIGGACTIHSNGNRVSITAGTKNAYGFQAQTAGATGVVNSYNDVIVLSGAGANTAHIRKDLGTETFNVMGGNLTTTSGSPTVVYTQQSSFSSGTGTFTGDVTALSFTIGANTLTTSEWAFLDGLDQAVLTTSTPTFSTLSLSATADQIILQSAGITTTITESGATSNKTITLPNITGTLASLAATAQIFAGAMTFTQTALFNNTSKALTMLSAGTGNGSLLMPSTASALSYTMPSVTTTLAGLAVTETFTAVQSFTGIVNIASGLTLTYAAKTTTYPITTADHTIDCTSGTFTVTLPTAVGTSGRGQVYVIKNSGTGVITLATTSSQTIDGATTIVLGVQYESITVMSNNANWIVI